MQARVGAVGPGPELHRQARSIVAPKDDRTLLMPGLEEGSPGHPDFCAALFRGDVLQLPMEDELAGHPEKGLDARRGVYIAPPVVGK